MAVKRTHELIPFCHPLAIERCDFAVDFEYATDLVIRCEVAVTHKTGVEMEALTGASVAALTVYDMCKALSHEIVIAEIRLFEKSGGKRTVRGGKDRDMNYRILYFASLRDAVGPRCGKRRDPIRTMRANFMRSGQRSTVLRCLPNDCASPSMANSPPGIGRSPNGDEIAFLPPVSGG